MPLVTLIVIAAILSVALYFAQMIPLQPLRMVVTVVLIIIVIIWLLTITGLANYTLPIGRRA